MSHVATVDLHITDLNAVEAACKELGLELVRGQKTFKWWGQWVNDYKEEDAAYHHGIKPEDYGKCEHAIRIPGDTTAYEIGLANRPDGKPGYALVFDFYGTYGAKIMAKVGGKGCEKLKQAYATEVAAKEATKMGYSVSRTRNPNGDMKLVCTAGF